MKPSRLEWNDWDELLGVAFHALEPQLQSKAIINIFKQNLICRAEDDFWKYGNGWCERKKDWVRIASKEFSELDAETAAVTTVEAVTLVASLDMMPTEQRGALPDAVAACLVKHEDHYSVIGIQDAKRNVIRQCVSVATDIAKGALRSRRSLKSDQIARILQVSISACEYYTKNPADAEYFPFTLVIGQLLKQSKQTLLDTKQLVEDLCDKFADLPWVYGAERTARQSLRRKCQELLAPVND